MRYIYIVDILNHLPKLPQFEEKILKLRHFIKSKELKRTVKILFSFCLEKHRLNTCFSPLT